TGSAQRQTGQVIGAFKEGEIQQIKCPNCGEMNPEDQPTCTNCGGSLVEPSIAPLAAQSTPAAPKPKSKLPLLLGLGAVALLCLCVILVITLTGNKDSLTGTVQNVAWTRSIAIEQYGLVTRDDWIDAIPQDATLGACELQYHHTQDEPAPNSEEVCGTPYTIDSGTGVGEVVQDCEYRVNLEYCEYRINDWQAFDELALQGTDLSPLWPNAQLSDIQRYGEQDENYAVYFATEDGILEYNPSSENQFLQCQIGSEWLLSTNAFGTIIEIEPAYE
ncbi:MAG: zinc ribbon domain-containing protein, partial [Anaerolineaceae bacterium]|nr:zinc ribbon domain-containing protein [Anaerolineaceae bacterium]